MKARPYADGAWSALPSGDLVWFERGLPAKVQLRDSFWTDPMTREERIVRELGWLTGQRYQLGRVSDEGEAEVLP